MNTKRDFPPEIDIEQDFVPVTPSQHAFRTRDKIVRYAKQAVETGTSVSKMNIPDRYRGAVRMWLASLLDLDFDEPSMKGVEKVHTHVEVMRGFVSRLWNELYEENFDNLRAFDRALVQRLTAIGWGVEIAPSKDCYFTYPNLKDFIHGFYIPSAKLNPPELLFLVEEGAKRGNVYLSKAAISPRMNLNRVSLVDLRKGEIFPRLTYQ